MEKYTKIFEDTSKEEWSNYCTIISYSVDDENCDHPEVYLCNNEHQGFIYLKNLIYDEFNENEHENYGDPEFYNNMLKFYSAANNLNDLYELFCKKYHKFKVQLVYCDLNEKVELDKWIIDWELNNTANKFNL